MISLILPWGKQIVVPFVLSTYRDDTLGFPNLSVTTSTFGIVFCLLYLLLLQQKRNVPFSDSDVLITEAGEMLVSDKIWLAHDGSGLSIVCLCVGLLISWQARAFTSWVEGRLIMGNVPPCSQQSGHVNHHLIVWAYNLGHSTLDFVGLNYIND